MIVRHGALYLAARVVPGVLSVATTALLTRLLAPEAYGTYGVTLIVMSLGSTVAFEWLGLSFLRFHEGHKDDPRTVPTFLALYLGMVALTGLLMAAAISLGAVPDGQAGLFAVGLVMAWAFALFELLARLEVASFRPGRYLRLNLLRAVLLAGCTLLAAALTRDPLWTAVGAASGLALAAAPSARRRLAVSRRLFDPGMARQVVRFGLPFALSMLLTGLFTGGVRTLVAMLTGTRELGTYTAAYNLAQNVLLVIAGAVGSATYPLAVRAYERGDPSALRAQLVDNLTLLLAVMVPACLGLCLAAPDLAATLVSPEFRPEVAALTPWMSLTVLLGALRGVYLDHSFQLGHRTGTQAVVSAGAAVLALAGTAVLVPAVGVVGGPVATTLAMLASCLHAWCAGRRGLAMPVPPGIVLKVAIAAAIMAGAVLAVPSGLPWSLPAKVAAGGVCYGAVCIAADLLGIRRHAAAAFHRLLRRTPRRWAG